MSMFKVLCVVFVLSLGLQAADNPVLDLWKKQVKEAKASITAIKPEELMEWNKQNKKFVLVDVREMEEINAGWIEADNLKKIPRGTLDPAVAKQGALKVDQIIVTYCKKGSRGALAGKMLKDLGFKNIYNLDGGIEGWMKVGFPIVNDSGTFKAVAYELTGLKD